MNQIDFLLNFFNLNKAIEEEVNKNQKKEVKTEDELDQSFPIYFKEVQVSPSEMKLNFYYSDESLINIRNASIKIANFIKSNKFYQFQDVCFNLFILLFLFNFSLSIDLNLTANFR